MSSQGVGTAHRGKGTLAVRPQRYWAPQPYSAPQTLTTCGSSRASAVWRGRTAGLRKSKGIAQRKVVPSRGGAGEKATRLGRRDNSSRRSSGRPLARVTAICVTVPSRKDRKRNDRNALRSFRNRPLRHGGRCVGVDPCEHAAQVVRAPWIARVVVDAVSARSPQRARR